MTEQRKDLGYYERRDLPSRFWEPQPDEEDLKRLSQVLSERNVADSALGLGQDAFANVYRFLVRGPNRAKRI